MMHVSLDGNDNWDVFDLERVTDSYMGDGWQAELVNDDTDSYMSVHRLDKDKPGEWYIHFYMQGSFPKFSHGYGGLGVARYILAAKAAARLNAACRIAESGFEPLLIADSAIDHVLLEDAGQLRIF